MIISPKTGYYVILPAQLQGTARPWVLGGFKLYKHVFHSTTYILKEYQRRNFKKNVLREWHFVKDAKSAYCPRTKENTSRECMWYWTPGWRHIELHLIHPIFLFLSLDTRHCVLHKLWFRVQNKKELMVWNHWPQNMIMVNCQWPITWWQTAYGNISLFTYDNFSCSALSTQSYDASQTGMKTSPVSMSTNFDLFPS